MRVELNLQPVTRNSKPLVFGWDSSTGELWGPDADIVRRLAEQAKSDGSVCVHPIPSSYEILRPLFDVTEMAAILGLRWKLSGELISHYPSTQKSPPDDQVMY